MDFFFFFVKHYIQTPTKTVLQLIEEKQIIFSNISLLRLGKDISIAMQNMTESRMSSLRLEKYNNT